MGVNWKKRAEKLEHELALARESAKKRDAECERAVVECADAIGKSIHRAHKLDRCAAIALGAAQALELGELCEIAESVRIAVKGLNWKLADERVRDALVAENAGEPRRFEHKDGAWKAA
jgi:hypothetical protein